MSKLCTSVICSQFLPLAPAMCVETLSGSCGSCVSTSSAAQPQVSAAQHSSAQHTTLYMIHSAARHKQWHVQSRKFKQISQSCQTRRHLLSPWLRQPLAWLQNLSLKSCIMTWPPIPAQHSHYTMTTNLAHLWHDSIVTPFTGLQYHDHKS